MSVLRHSAANMLNRTSPEDRLQMMLQRLAHARLSPVLDTQGEPQETVYDAVGRVAATDVIATDLTDGANDARGTSSPGKPSGRTVIGSRGRRTSTGALHSTRGGYPATRPTVIAELQEPQMTNQKPSRTSPPLPLSPGPRPTLPWAPCSHPLAPLSHQISGDGASSI